ncbi:MAG: hypothetical protein LBF72_04275 [Holosporales bacterium]|nr:hypothetical protein [Holosporales bacterium]
MARTGKPTNQTTIPAANKSQKIQQDGNNSTSVEPGENGTDGKANKPNQTTIPAANKSQEIQQDGNNSTSANPEEEVTEHQGEERPRRENSTAPKKKGKGDEELRDSH